MKRKFFGFLLSCLIVVAFGSLAKPAQAATRTWTGGGADNNWATAANWGGTAPVAGDDLVFDATGVGVRPSPNNNIVAGTSFATITVSASGYTISGNSVSLTTGLTADTYASGTSTVSLIVGGAGSVTMNAAGKLVLSGVNTFTGGLTIKAGTIQANTSNRALGGATGTGTVTIGDTSGSANATLLIGTSGLTFANPIVLATGTGGILTIGNYGTAISATFSGGVTGNNNLTIDCNATTGAITFSTVSVNNAGTVANVGAGTGTVTVSAIIGTNVTGVIQNSATSQLTLSGVNTFAGGLIIKSGKVSGITSASAFGAGSITIGDTGGSANTILSGGLAGTFANPISVASGNTGSATITDSAASIFSGAVTLNSHDLVLSPVASNLTLSGGITGTGNLTLNTTGAGVITLSTNSVNNSGTITNSGTGATAATVSGGVGANVTAVTENSATSALTISTTALTVNAGGTTLTNSNAASSSLLTVSGGVAGAGNLILNNNSAIYHGITLSTNPINNTGTVTNSGAGTGSVLINGGVGSNVASVTNASLTSALTVATIVYVNPTWVGTPLGTDPDGAGPATDFGGDAFATIQSAITGVANGATVNVAAGTYAGGTSVSKAIFLRGAKAGIDARTRDGSGESIIAIANATVGFGLNSGAQGATIDGFKLIGNPPPIATTTQWATGINGTPGSNTHIDNNIFQDLSLGIIFSPMTVAEPAATSTVSHNVFKNIIFTAAGSAAGDAMYLNKIVNVSIDNNDFSDIGYSGMVLTGGLYSNNNYVVNNTITRTGMEAINVYLNNKNLVVKGNTIDQAGLTADSTDKGGIRIYNPPGLITVTENTVTNSNCGFCVRAANDITSSTISVSYNNFTGNTYGGIFHNGSGGALNATNNWFGTPTPTLGVDIVVTNTSTASVSFSPWLSAPFGTSLAPAITTTITSPPVINLKKTPSPLALPNGPGLVTYTYTVTNPGKITLTDITVTDDKCDDVVYVSGDTNGDKQLEPGETWTYKCTVRLTKTTINYAMARGLGNGIAVIDNTIQEVIVGAPTVSPLIGIVKKAEPSSLPVGGGSVTYTYAITNPGTVSLTDVDAVDDKCGPVVFVSGDANKNFKLETNEVWTYRCTTSLKQTTTNSVSATGHANGLTAIDTAVMTVVVAGSPSPSPLIHIFKKAEPITMPAGGGWVTYTYTVTNPGTVPLGNVSVTDDRCNGVIAISGDANGNSMLETNETWIYTCRKYLAYTTTNTATAKGSANGLTATYTAVVNVMIPGTTEPKIVTSIHIKKKAEPITMPADGGWVTYTYTVTNPGTVSLNNVSVTDDKCKDVTFVSGDANSNSSLEPDEKWIYTCRKYLEYTTTNTATARGSTNNLTVTDTSIASVAIIATTEPGAAARIRNLQSLGLSVHDLVKLADDHNPKTKADTTIYYLGADGRRHAFPNSGVFFSWYCDFSKVRILRAANLAKIPLGRNIAFRPGPQELGISPTYPSGSLRIAGYHDPVNVSGTLICHGTP